MAGVYSLFVLDIASRLTAMPAYLTTADTPAISIQHLCQAGFIQSPSCSSKLPENGDWTLRRSNGEVCGIVRVCGGSDMIRVCYRIGNEGQQLEQRNDQIEIAWTPCNFGGFRAKLVCPGIGFGGGRLVTTLYAALPGFACRHCHALTYESRNRSRMDRLLGPVERLRAQLQIPHGEPVPPFLTRPKGMRRARFERLCIELRAAIAKADRQMLSLMR